MRNEGVRERIRKKGGRDEWNERKGMRERDDDKRERGGG